jgi:hypothetical protein
MKFLHRTSITLGLATRGFAQSAMAVSSLFAINLENNDEGGCGYVGQTFMQSILKDSYDLATIGSQLVIEYREDKGGARRLLDSFFQVENPPMTETHLDMISSKSFFPRKIKSGVDALQVAYSTVSNWIANGGAYNGGAATVQPYLFCYDNWLQRKTMKDPAQDTLGETFPDVWTGLETLINQVPELVAQQKAEIQAFKQLKINKQAVTVRSNICLCMIQVTDAAF